MGCGKGVGGEKHSNLRWKEAFSSGKLDPVVALGTGVWDAGSHSNYPVCDPWRWPSPSDPQLLPLKLREARSMPA